MDRNKSSVSSLQEYCAKNKRPAPLYDFISTEDGFVCSCKMADNMEVQSCGRSKRDAKHTAAAEIVKRLRLNHAKVDEIPQMSDSSEDSPRQDMIIKLRDYCVQNSHPLPIIEVLQQSGVPDTPQFTAVCKLASLQRYGYSENKKDAKQKAAVKMLNSIQKESNFPDGPLDMVSLDAAIQAIDEKRYLKFKTYRELSEATAQPEAPIKLRDRHNFFKNFHTDLKAAAQLVIQTAYDSQRTKAYNLFEALQLKPTIKKMTAVNKLEQMVVITFDCEYETCIADYESKVYTSAINYFRDMLL